MLPIISDAAILQSLVALNCYNVNWYIVVPVLNICAHVLYYKCSIVDSCEDITLALLWQLVQKYLYFVIFCFIHTIQLHLIM